MGFFFTTEQINAMNNISPRLISAGVDLGDQLDAIKLELASGNLGIEADAWDVDAVCQDSNCFAQDENTTAGLTFGYFAGRLLDGQTIATIGASTVVLAPSQTNYVQVRYIAGTWTVEANTVGFTAGALPLYVIVTGVGTISTIANKRMILEAHRDGGITGTLLSTSGATKELPIWLGTVNATTTFRLIMPNNTAHVARSLVSVGTTIAQSDATYWSFGQVGKGAAGVSNKVVVDDTAPNNTTKVTGGAALTADIARALNLSGVSADLDTLANESHWLKVTKTGAVADLVGLTWKVDLTFTN